MRSSAVSSCLAFGFDLEEDIDRCLTSRPRTSAVETTRPATGDATGMHALDFEARGFAELIDGDARQHEPGAPHAAEAGYQRHAEQCRAHAIGIERAHRPGKRGHPVLHMRRCKSEAQSPCKRSTPRKSPPGHRVRRTVRLALCDAVCSRACGNRRRTDRCPHRARCRSRCRADQTQLSRLFVPSYCPPRKGRKSHRPRPVRPASSRPVYVVKYAAQTRVVLLA